MIGGNPDFYFVGIGFCLYDYSLLVKTFKLSIQALSPNT